MYSIDSRVRYSECSSDALLSPLGIVNYLQDCSIFHTEQRPGGIAGLRDEGYAWFIAAWQIRILRTPRFNEDIKVSTWVPSMGNMLTPRNFLITGSDGEHLVEADSSWFVFDLATNQPIHPPEAALEPYINDNEPALDMPKTRMKLKLEGETHELQSFAIEEELLDTNMHVNNANYIRLALECAQLKSRPTCIEAIYRQAAKLGDEIYPIVGVSEEATTVDLCSGDGSSYCVVRFS